MDEVQEYAKAFWERINDLSDKERIIKGIEKGENTINQRIQYNEILVKKCSKYKSPREEMHFEFESMYNKSRSKFFTAENDKFLIYSTYKC